MKQNLKLEQEARKKQFVEKMDRKWWRKFRQHKYHLLYEDPDGSGEWGDEGSLDDFSDGKLNYQH